MFKKYLTLIALVPFIGISSLKAASFSDDESGRMPTLSRHTSLASNLMEKVFDQLDKDPRTGKKLSHKDRKKAFNTISAK